MTHTRSKHSRSGPGRWIYLAIALLVGSLLAVVSQAQPRRGGFAHGQAIGGPGHGSGHGGGHGPGPFLFGADTNEDGALGLDELNAFLATVDANGDGILAHEELRAAAEARAVEAGFELPEAGPRAERRHEHVMERLDANEDGLLQTSEVEAHFGELDADGNGIVSGDELPRHGRHGGQARHRMAIDMALNAADADDDGNVTLSEWNAFLATVDEDGDGQVTFEEVRRQAAPDFEPPSVSLEQANEIFDHLDADGDGVVTEDEIPQRRGPQDRRGRGGRGRGI